MNSHFRRLAIAIGATLLASFTNFGQAALYDGFSGTAGNLAGQAGGTGWGGALWYNNFGGSQPVQVSSGSMTFSGLTGYSGASASGNRATTQGSGTGAYRYLNQGTLGSDSTTVWISFLIQRTAGSSDGYGGLSLYTEATDEHFFIGQRSGQNVLGFQRNGTGGSGANTSTSADTKSFLVVRIDFTSSGENAWLWVNPDPSSTPGTGSAAASLTAVPNFTFNTIRLQSGGNSSPDFDFDEFRFGTTFADVNPVPEPVNIALGVFGAAVFCSLGFRRLFLRKCC